MKIFNYFKKKETSISLNEMEEINLFGNDIHSESFLEKVKELKEVNKKFQEGLNLLHFACEYTHVNLAKELIKRDINIEEKNDFGNTPLWFAVFNSRGNYELVDLLLLHNANPNSVNNANNTPLKFAETIGDTILINKLKEALINL